MLISYVLTKTRFWGLSFIEYKYSNVKKVCPLVSKQRLKNCCCIIYHFWQDNRAPPDVDIVMPVTETCGLFY